MHQARFGHSFTYASDVCLRDRSARGQRLFPVRDLLERAVQAHGGVAGLLRHRIKAEQRLDKVHEQQSVLASLASLREDDQINDLLTVVNGFQRLVPPPAAEKRWCELKSPIPSCLRAREKVEVDSQWCSGCGRWRLAAACANYFLSPEGEGLIELQAAEVPVGAWRGRERTDSDSHCRLSLVPQTFGRSDSSTPSCKSPSSRR